MAEKFSQFNSESTLGNITGLVGFITGTPGTNVKISPADLLAGITAVSTLDMGSTGLTPTVATSGAVSVSGTLVAGSGGTGRSSYNIGSLLVADSASSLGELNAGLATHVLTANGAGVAPSWQPASGGSGGLSYNVTTETSNYSASDGDIVLCDVTGSLRVTLPAAASNAVVGVKYKSQNAVSDVLDVITPTGVEIDGVVRSSVALVLPSVNTYYEFISDGTNWFIK